MISFNEYGEIIRPEEFCELNLQLNAGVIKKAQSYNNDVTKLLVYINELEFELQKFAFLKEKSDDVFKYIKTIKKIQELTINILPIPISRPTG